MILSINVHKDGKRIAQVLHHLIELIEVAPGLAFRRVPFQGNYLLDRL